MSPITAKSPRPPGIPGFLLTVDALRSDVAFNVDWPSKFLTAHPAPTGAEPPTRHAAMAVGDAAASAHLDPLAAPEQVGHILRELAYCVLALQHRAVKPLTSAQAIEWILEHSTAPAIDMQLRHPRGRNRRKEVASVVDELDAALRRASHR